MKRIDFLKEVLADAKLALINNPNTFPLESIIDQLNYLIDLEEGQSSDFSKLNKIKIGWIAARELDGFSDKKFIDKLHLVSKEVEAMKRERGLSDD